MSPNSSYYARRGKADANHKSVQEALEAHGCVCVSTAIVGGGFPDIVAARAFHGVSGATSTPGRTFLVEVKMPKGKLEQSQRDFMAKWPGEVLILRSAEAVHAYFARLEDGAALTEATDGDGIQAGGVL